jgi:hypothetical protein
MPTLYEGLGTERICDVITVVLAKELAGAIDVHNAKGHEEDQWIANELGIPPIIVDLEPVPLGNLHVGSLPSFIQSADKPENFPLVAVTPTRTTPDPEDASMDQYSVLQNAVSIHCICKASPKEGPTIAWRRSERMSEAIHYVVSTNHTVRNAVAGISGPMLVDRTEPWAFKVEGRDEDWWWFGVMRTYNIKNYSMTP